MKIFNLPPEGVRILIGGIIAIAILALISGCGTLTTLDSCKEKVGDQKRECVERVEARQRALENRREFFIGLRR